MSPPPSSTAGSSTVSEAPASHHPCPDKESLSARSAPVVTGDASMNEGERSTPIRHGSDLLPIPWRVVLLVGFAVLSGVSAIGLVAGLQQSELTDRSSRATPAEIELVAEALPARLPAAAPTQKSEPPASPSPSSAAAVAEAAPITSVVPPQRPEPASVPAVSGIALTGAIQSTAATEAASVPTSPPGAAASPIVATVGSPTNPATGAILAGGIADDEEHPSILIRANRPSP